MVNKKLVVLFGVLASGTALSQQKLPRVPKAVVKGFGAGVLTLSLWNAQPSNGAMLEDALMVNKALDQVIKNNNPTKVESPYPQPTLQERKRLKEKDAEEQRKMNELVRNKDLDKAKNEINQNTDKKIEKLNTKIDGVESKIDTSSVVLGVLTLANSVVLGVLGLDIMAYFKNEENEIKRLELKVEENELELKKKAAEAAEAAKSAESWWPWK